MVGLEEQSGPNFENPLMTSFIQLVAQDPETAQILARRMIVAQEIGQDPLVVLRDHFQPAVEMPVSLPQDESFPAVDYDQMTESELAAAVWDNFDSVFFMMYDQRDARPGQIHLSKGILVTNNPRQVTPEPEGYPVGLTGKLAQGQGVPYDHELYKLYFSGSNVQEIAYNFQQAVPNFTGRKFEPLKKWYVTVEAARSADSARLVMVGNDWFGEPDKSRSNTGVLLFDLPQDLARAVVKRLQDQETKNQEPADFDESMVSRSRKFLGAIIFHEFSNNVSLGSIAGGERTRFFEKGGIYNAQTGVKVYIPSDILEQLSSGSFRNNPPLIAR